MGFNEWQIVKLEDVCCKIGSGATPRGGQNVYLNAGVYTLIRSQNIYNEGFSQAGLVFLTKHHAEELSNVEVQSGDVLLNITGDSVARCCQVDERVLPARVNQHVSIVRPDSSKLDPRFLRYFLISPQMQFLMLSWAGSGATRNALTKGMIESFEIPLPPLDEQKAIAHILGTLDDKIELNQQMNQTLEAMAQAIFKSWFVDFDPVRAKLEGRQPANMDAETAALFPAEFEESAIGKIPKTWKVQKLIEVTSKIGSGATPRGGSQVYIDEGISLIRSQNVYDYQFSWDGLARITEETAEQLRNVIVEPNDILLNITGDSILRTCVVEPAVLPARVNQHVSIIRAIPEISCRYLHLYLVQPQMKSFLLGFDTGGTRKAVTKGQLESVPVPIPSEMILHRFRKITDPLYERINSNLAESRTLTSARDALLPKLLSGEIRVQDAEKVVEVAA